MDRIRFKKKLEFIDGVRREEMSEREYYTKMVTFLYSLGDSPNLSRSQCEELREALVKTGAQTYDEWVEEKRKRGEIVRDGLLYDECQHGDIAAGVSYVSQILGNPEDVGFAISFMNEGGPEYAWASIWIKESERILMREKREAELRGLMKKDDEVNGGAKKSKKEIDKKSPNDDGDEPADD